MLKKSINTKEKLINIENFDVEHRFQCLTMNTVQDYLFLHMLTQYGPTIQYAEMDAGSPLLDNNSKTFVQEVTQTFLYY